MLWWKPASGNDGTWRQLFTYGAHYNQGNVEIFKYTGEELYAEYHAGGEANPFGCISAPLSWSAETWYHIVLVWDLDNDRFEIYRNGGSVAANSPFAGKNAVVPADNRIGVGANLDNNNPANGVIDDFVLVDRALGAEEVRTIYESSAPLFAETSTWGFKTANTLAWADSEGLWAIDDLGNPAFGVSGVLNKSWGGQTLNKGDVLLGRATAYARWNASLGTLEVKGTIQADAGYFGGVSIAASKVYSGAGNYANVDTPFYLGSDGQMSLKDKLTWNGSALAIQGQITASSGSFTGVINIGASGGIYQGSGTFANPATGFKLYNDAGVGVMEWWKGGVLQLATNGNGQLIAGTNDQVVLDGSGINLFVTPDVQWDYGYKLSVNEFVIGGLRGYTGGMLNAVDLIAQTTGTKPGHLYLGSENGGTELSYVGVAAKSGSNDVRVNVNSGALAADRYVSVTGGDLNAPDGKIRTDVAFNRSGTNGYIFVPQTALKTLVDSGANNWDGSGTRPTGTYIFRPEDNALPAAAKAIAIRMSGQWGSAGNSYAMAAKPRGGAYSAGIIRSVAANILSDACVIVPCDTTNGDIEIAVGGGTVTAPAVYLIGYFI